MESNVQIWHWEIEICEIGSVSSRKILLYSEIYGVGSTAGISDTNSKFNPGSIVQQKHKYMSL